MTFLEQVARYYATNAKEGELHNYTFIFPSKRSAMYMEKWLETMGIPADDMPKCITSTAFIQKLSKLKVAKSTELLFLLYDCYNKVLTKHGRKDQIKDFDSFIFWGKALIDDFNDVDAYMADAHQLFSNIKAQNEINTDYLTPKQKEIANMLGSLRPFYGEEGRFWSHVPDNKKELTDSFLSLWEILGELYDDFKKVLLQRKLAYSGMQSRMIAEAMKAGEFDDNLLNVKYAFIGFYVLPKARVSILKYIRDKKIADFFWDTATPMLRMPGSKIGNLILPLAKEFKKPTNFELEGIDKMPAMDVYAVPSGHAQAKVGAYILEKWHEEDKKEEKTNNSILPDTALVLANDRLLMPVLYSLPCGDDPVNVAMKVPMSITPFASTIASILLMREKSTMIRGERHFFYKYVLELASNPFLSLVDAQEVVDLKEFVTRNHLYNVKAKDLCQRLPHLAFIFDPDVNPNDIDDIKEYMENLIKGFSVIETEKAILGKYQKILNEIATYTAKYGVKMNEHSYFTLIRRLIRVEEIHFNSSPLQGMQIMNMSDARALDFDNLCILAANEKMLPSTNHKPSLIPPPLRHGYGLPTRDDDETNTSYLFFRLISRAKRLAITYDSRSADINKGEMSRYIRQLKQAKTQDHDMVFHQVNMNKCLEEPHPIEIKKTDTIMAEINQLRAGIGHANLSASALKSYIACPLRFYLREVKRIKVDDFDPEYMDAASYGQVVHSVAEKLYWFLSRKNRAKGELIEQKDIKQWIEHKDFEAIIRKVTLREIDIIYYKKKYFHHLDALPGEARVLSKVIAKYITLMLTGEMNAGKPFTFLKGEYNGNLPKNQKWFPWKITDDITINFTMSIDRIDSILGGAALRFIDYKTGSDQTTFKSVDELFTNHNVGGIFQLFLYCLAYADLEKCDLPIQPIIYLFKDMAKGISPIRMGSETSSKNQLDIVDYKQQIPGTQTTFAEDFRKHLVDMITEIFNPEINIKQTEDINECKYCTFAPMCGRFVKDNDY